MDWAHKRRWMVWTVLGAAVLAVLLIIGFAVFYKTPTCFDTKQNGDETGIDCGGTCNTLCSVSVSPATVRFARVLQQSGRNDLIAYIDNPNTDAHAKDAELDLTIYLDSGRTLERTIEVSFPAKASAPVYIPGIANASIQRVFAEFATGSPTWMRGSGWESPAPSVGNILIESTDARPRITATIENQTAYVARSIPFIATVFDASGAVIAASQTIVPVLPPQGTAQAVFTWNEPFAAAYARVDIVPVITLPAFVP